MKFIALAAALFLAGVHSEDKVVLPPAVEKEIDKIVEFTKRCKDSEKPNEEALGKLEQGVAIEDESVGKYFLCILNNMNLVDENGHLKEENIETEFEKLQFLPPIIGILTNECVKDAEDPKHTALNFAECIIRYMLDAVEYQEEEKKESENA